MIHLLNKLITKFRNTKSKRKAHKKLRPDLEKIFEKFGEGLFVCNIRSSPTNFVSNIIGKISCYREYGKKAPLAHTVIIYYGNIKKLLEGNSVHTSILEKKLAGFYKNPPTLDELKATVLCSADENGMNYFDFSNYQNRDFSLRPFLNVDYKKQRAIVKDFIAQHNKPYDYTGLFFWIWYKLFKFLRFMDDSKSWFCSEVSYEISKRHGYKIARRDNPSPADCEKINKFACFKYRTKGFLR